MTVVAVVTLISCRSASDAPEPSVPATVTAPAGTSIVDGPIRGALPDGTIYDVVVEPIRHEEVTTVSAGIEVVGDGTTHVVDVSFSRFDAGTTGWHDNQYRMQDGAWTVDLSFSEDALVAMGPDPRPAVEESVAVTTHLGLPLLDLSPPLRWAADDEVPMQVVYETFAVRRGCGERAAACNPPQAVQVIPLQEISPDAPVWPYDEAAVVSYALRRPSHPHYMDPGPLTGRSGHDVVWTGEEMVVWGGTAPMEVEGAAFDPEADAWRMLRPAPLAAQQPTRAVWTDTRMVVLSEEATVAYDPETDSWERIGEGIDPPTEPRATVWTGKEVVTWTGDGAQSFSPDAGRWVDLGRPGSGRSVLRVMDGRLYAVGPEGCDRRVIRAWNGDDWEEVVEAPSEAVPDRSCPRMEQVGAVDGRFILWRDESHPTFVYDLSRNAWQEASPIPLRGLEQPVGPVPIGDRFLVTRWSEGAIFDPATDEWTRVDLPGYGTDSTMVWTGEELLMWDRCCYVPEDVDAWRWNPPTGG